MKTFLRGSVITMALLVAVTAQAEVKLGVAGPFTGPSASFGAQFRAGVEQAAEDINKAGGINGQAITVVFGDDVSDPKQGISVANHFVGDNVSFVIGHYNSGVSIPASEVYAENQVLMITPSGTNPKLTERGLWNVFRTCGRDDQQGGVAADYILKNLRTKKVAIVHDKTVASQGLADEVKKNLNAGGLSEVLFEGVNPGDKDYSALIAKMKSLNVDLIYWAGLHTEGGLIVRQLHDQGVTAGMMAADGIATDEFASIAGPGAEGTLMTFAPDPRKRAEAASVVNRFLAKNINPEAYTLYSYAAVEVIQQAAERAKSLDPQTVAAAIRSGDVFNTVIGQLSYDSKGDITRPDYVMYVWKKDNSGKHTYVESN